MQSWSRGSYCLRGSLQASFCPRHRGFATSPSLLRAKKHVKLDAGPKSPRSSPSLVPRKPKPTPPDFPVAVATILEQFKSKTLQSSPSGPEIHRWKRFERYVMNACQLQDKARGSPLQQTQASLQKAYLSKGVPGLRAEIEYLLYADEITAKYSRPNIEQQKKVADLRYPAEWYPQARAMQRTIHLHVGPTNSGKTYHALKRLEASKSGFYAGPLRLLAQEVYQRFVSNGIRCSLVTGDDVKIPEGEPPAVVSNTVEMVNFRTQFEVGVIDEIQMIADSRRGWAWTQAVLGARASELHLCGEARAVPLIRELAALTGDKLEIHRYERLNPLKVMDQSLKGDLRNLEKGDCVVSFSRLGIHALRADIEKLTGKRAAIVYGGLPAEIRTQQAKLFNDPDNDYDFLVASDAIGMGLNLSIKRIVFETLVKRVPAGLMKLSIPEIKQIAGRAGRYRTASQGKEEDGASNVGWVTAMEQVDIPQIHQAMKVEASPITAAGVFPPNSVIERFASYFPRGVPFEYIIKRLIEVCRVHPLFFLCDPKGQVENAQVIDMVDGLTIDDQLTFMAAPLDSRDESSRDVACAFAQCVAEHLGGGMLDIPEINLEVLEEPVSGNKEYLHELETLHKAVILYLWLSFRCGGVFTDRTLATHVKQLVEERMVRTLTEFSANKRLRKDSSLHRQIALQKQIQEHRRLLAEVGQTDEAGEENIVDLPAQEDASVQEDASGEPNNNQEAQTVYNANA